MKNVLLIFVGIILLVSIPILVFFVGQRQELRNKAAPATTLSITPNTASAAVEDTIIWKILINTGENRVASVKISLIFDQTRFEAQSITNSTLAPRILNQGTVGAGTATITVAAESTAKPINGQGEIAILRLKALSGSASPVTVQFAPDTFVAGIGEETVNVLTSSQPGSITITGGNDLTAAPTDSTIPTPVISSPTPIPTPVISSPTPIPTIKPLENLISQPGTPSALTVSILKEASTGGVPVIIGKAPPGSTVTIVIHSTPQTLVAIADENGNWIATPSSSLESGNHTVVVTTQNATTGTTETTSSMFTMETAIGGTESTSMIGEELPTSGSTEITAILLFIGSLTMVFGGLTLVKKYI